jgi:ATP-dependent helicase/nuclease subunit A
VTGEQLSLTAAEVEPAAPPAGPGEAPSPPPVTPEQRRAISRREIDVLLEAGAGTGKTRVLVERYCEAAEEDGIDAILAFTFTERAAGELRHRIREELRRRAAEAAAAGQAERARLLAELSRESERAWISTIHGFCRRLLATHPVALGLDPRFRVLDELEAERVALRAFDEALERFLADSEPGRPRFVAAMRVTTLRDLVITAHDELRGQGREIALPQPAAPDVEPALAKLAGAARAAVEETTGGAGGARNLERLALAAEIDPAVEIPSEAQVAALELATTAKAFSGPACKAYKQAQRAARTALAERDAVAAYRHLGELVDLFAGRFAALKDERSALDFEDLQLEARRLLKERPLVADTYRERLRHLMVDEFQDTNRLQLELIGLLRGEHTAVFCVGDEFQSIYGFRHADVEVFRRERERIERLPDAEAQAMPLAGNFRSHGEVIASVNAIGEALFGEGFTPLRVGTERAGANAGEPAVELLLTPAGDAWKEKALGIKAQGDYPSAPDRVAEARFLAARLRRLVDAGTPRGDIVVLLRAYTHVGAFEEQLERAGLRPYVVGGRGYWSQQQVDDVRRIMAVIANPLDDESLLGMLASPACAVLPDTLWLLRRAAGGKHLWPVVERAFGAGGEGSNGATEDGDDEERARWLAAVPPEDAARLRELCALLRELRAEAPRHPLDVLVERALVATGYDLAVLGMDRGPRRYANVRKLMRMARAYESTDGRDLRGFLDFLAERAGADREGEAATEAEDHDGVRVMTVHAAKGLEFPVVAVADLGRDLLTGGRPPTAIVGDLEDERDREQAEVAAPRVGIRLARFGTTAIGVFGYDELRDAAVRDEAAEACRLAYVAATRAQDVLLLSGRYSAHRVAKAAEEGLADSTPISERLMCALEIDAGTDTVIELPPAQPREGLDARPTPGRLAVVFNRPEPEAFARLRPAGASVAAPDRPTLEPPPLGRPATPIEPAARHLSYSALALFGRCGYRFFTERVVGLAPRDSAPGQHGPDDERPGADRYGFGNAVHGLLEWSARRGWREPDPELCRELLRREQLSAGAEEVERARGMVTAWLSSELCRELEAGAARVRPEMPFILPLGESVVRGTIDLLAEDGEAPLVVDYKTDSLGERSLDELIDRYGVQRDVYALAVAGAAQRVRSAYVFLERADEPVVRVLDAHDLAAAHDQLERLVGAIRRGEFAVTPEPHAALCWDCPARDRLCSHPPELTGRRLPLPRRPAPNPRPPRLSG